MAGTVNRDANIRAIYGYLKAKGASSSTAAGVLGNMQTETGNTFDPGIINPNEGAIGLCQWELDRRTALQNFAKQRHTSESDLGTQLDFMWLELQTNKLGVWPAMQATHDPRQAAAIWDGSYENSSGDARTARQNNATAYYQAIQNGGIVAGDVPSGSTTGSDYTGDPKYLHPPFDPNKLKVPLGDKRGAMINYIRNHSTFTVSAATTDADLLTIYQVVATAAEGALFGDNTGLPGWLTGVGTGVRNAAGHFTDWAAGLAAVLSWLTTLKNWERIGLFALGAIILIFAAFRMFESTPEVVPS